jgi:hypothetical protein
LSDGLDPNPVEIPEDFAGTPEPPPPGRKRSVRRPAKGRQSAAPKAAPRPRRQAASVPGPADTVKSLLQIPATAVVMVGQRAGSVPLVADGATVIVHGPAFASAIEEWAKVDPRVAIILEKLVAFGPASAVATVLVIMGAQFYRNHDESSAPLTGGLGAVSATEIINAAGLPIPEPISPNGQRPGPDGSETSADSPTV